MANPSLYLGKKYIKYLCIFSGMCLITLNSFAATTMTLECAGSTSTHYCCKVNSGSQWSSGTTPSSCINGTSSKCSCSVGSSVNGCTVTACN